MATPAVPNSSYEVARDNLETLDKYINNTSGTVTNRDGRVMTPLPVLEQIVQDLVDATVFIPVAGSFQAGGTLTLRNNVLLNTADSSYYSWGGTLPKVVPSGSTPATAGGLGVNAWVLRADTTLRSELGSAAFKDEQTSTSDTTLGRLMRVGAFGLGGDAVLAPTLDLNLLGETGFYITETSGVLNLPSGWTQTRHYVEVIGKVTGSYCYQRIINIGTGGTSGSGICRVAERRMRTTGVWSDWFETITTNTSLFRELQPNVANVTALRSRVALFANQKVNLVEYSSNTGSGGGEFIWSAASTEADNGVTIFAVTGVTTGRWVRQYQVLTVEMAGAVGNNTSSATNDAAIARAIAFAKIDNRELHWEGYRYLTSSANIADFHSVKHVGSATISKNGIIWYITPKGEQENVIHVSPTGLSTGDGLSTVNPTTINRAIDTLKNIGDKSSDGIWRIQMSAGTFTENGVRLSDLPVFKNKLRLWGADVALTTVPTTIWDGTSSTNAYAIRSDSLDSALLYLHLKNIKFVDWVAAGLAGAITVWSRGAREYENIHADNISIGIWDRHGQSRITYGRIENYDTYGIAIQYNATSNIGNLSGGGVYLRGRIASEPQGIAVGRNSTVYIQGCDIDGNHTHINNTRLSRIRTQSNTYGANFNVACVWCDTMAVWTPDNGQGFPDTYPTLTEIKPAYRGDMGSIHQKIDRLSSRSLHAVSDGGIIVITDTSQNQLATLNNTFTPFRLPKWFLYSPTFRLDVEIGISVSTGGGGVLTLNAQGSTSTTLLASITIPDVAATTKGTIRFSVIQRQNVSTAYYSSEFKAGGILNEYVNTANLSNTAIRTNSEDDNIYRLYWTSNNTTQVQIFNMRTYVES